MPAVGVISTALIDPAFFEITALSLFPGGSKFEAFLEDTALYPTGGNKIHDFNVSYTKWILGIWKQKVYIVNRQLYQPSSFNKHYDNYGGCFVDVAGYAGGATMSGLFMRDKFGFIPTSSSLGIEATTDADFKRAYIGAQPPVAPLNSPFANFTTAFKTAANLNKNNEKHLELNARNGNWLAAELNGLPENDNCSFLCNGGITGLETLCTPSTYTAPSGASVYNWQIINGSNLISFTNINSSSIVITPQLGVNGSVTIRVYISGISTTSNSVQQNCGYLEKTIWVGKPSFDLWVDGPDNAHTFVSLVSADTNLPIDKQGITNVIIRKTENNGVVSTILSGGVFFTRRFNPSTTRSLTVTVTNSCGVTTNIWSMFNFMRITTPTETKLYAVFPNPATDIINIELREKSEKPAENKNITAVLYNMMGEQKANIEVKNNRASLSTSYFPKGLYILKIIVDGITESHHIAIE